MVIFDLLIQKESKMDKYNLQNQKKYITIGGGEIIFNYIYYYYI